MSFHTLSYCTEYRSEESQKNTYRLIITLLNNQGKNMHPIFRTTLQIPLCALMCYHR